MAQSGSRGTWMAGSLMLNHDVMIMSGTVAPTNNVTGKGKAGPGSLYIYVIGPAIYYNANTKAAPTWTAITLP